MRVIQKQAATAEKVLGKQPFTSDEDKRFLTYCLAVSCEEGILLFNVLTKELVLLENAEAALIDPERLNESAVLKENGQLFRYLFENWFLIPANNDDRELCLNLRSIAQHLNRQNSPQGFTAFTILTTTDCNARCFYCYEKGARRINMSRETALKTADFIRENYCQAVKTTKSSPDDIKISISWFGGEPLFNSEVIDIISEELTKNSVPFNASMITNGYLFDSEIIRKAVDCWNLKTVQITLDGTQEVYNRRKAYIYKDDNNPFLRVIDNMGKLLDAGIKVSIRLNLDNENFEDLLELADWIAERFPQQKDLTVYCRYIYNSGIEGISQDNRALETMCCHMRELQCKLDSLGLLRSVKLSGNIKINRCMADNDASVLMQADGKLGKCEYFFDSLSYGSITEGVIDKKNVDCWKVLEDDEPACLDCPLYPDCIRLNKCISFYTYACKSVPAMKSFNIEAQKENMTKAYQQSSTEGDNYE